MFPELGFTSTYFLTVNSLVIEQCADEIGAEARSLRDIYDEHPGLRDRFSGAGRLDPELASCLGVVGVAGRASGQPLNLRLDLPHAPYDALGVRRCVQQEGDVLARVAVRFEELAESLRLVRDIVANLPAGSHAERVVAPVDGTSAVGLVVGWRGPVVVSANMVLGSLCTKSFQGHMLMSVFSSYAEGTNQLGELWCDSISNYLNDPKAMALGGI